MVVAVLFSAGDQVPVILFSEVVGNGFSVAPEQIGAIALKVGVTCAVMVMLKVCGLAHWPAVGVNV